MLGEDERLPDAAGLSAPFTSLTDARFGVSWGVFGAARACYEAALGHTGGREQFGRPIASFQLVQARLAEMALALAKAQLLALHLGRPKDAGRCAPEHISTAKLDNVRVARPSRATPAGCSAATGSPTPIRPCGTWPTSRRC